MYPGTVKNGALINLEQLPERFGTVPGRHDVRNYLERCRTVPALIVFLGICTQNGEERFPALRASMFRTVQNGSL